MKLVLGTRGSLLARTQSGHVKDWLEQRVAGLEVEMRVVHTEGDRLQREAPAPGQPLEKGLFTKALEDALLSGAIDLAVHSLKDVPTEQPAGLAIAAIPRRVDPRDALVSGGARFADLRRGAVVATGSPRRSFQLQRLRPDLSIVPVRGNVDTRIRKVRDGEFDAVVLAAAGLERIGRAGEATELFDVDAMLPAPGQGALAVETREGEVASFVRAALDDADTRAAVEAERGVLVGLGGGCQLPLGAFAAAASSGLHVTAVLFSADGKRSARLQLAISGASPRELGLEVATRLLAALDAAGNA